MDSWRGFKLFPVRHISSAALKALAYTVCANLDLNVKRFMLEFHQACCRPLNVNLRTCTFALNYTQGFESSCGTYLWAKHVAGRGNQDLCWSFFLENSGVYWDNPASDLG